MKVAFLTGGTIGAGHVSHALAVQGGLRRNLPPGSDLDYRVFAPRRSHYVRRIDAHQVALQREDLADPERAMGTTLAAELRAYGPDLVLVDMFWALLRYLIDPLELRAWLLVRVCPERWLEGRPGLLFEASQFERIVGIEPMPYGGITHQVQPLVVSNPDECLPRHALRQRYGVGVDEELTLVVQAGHLPEAEALSQLAEGREGAVVVMNARVSEAPVPAAPWLGGADRIVSGGGYNIFWETRWLGLADRAELVPFRRPIDDQRWRLENGDCLTMTENGADQLAREVLGALL